jgi:3-oxoacyl-[acyl-carrier-protein] synthase-3
MPGSTIIGWGASVPDRVVTNAELTAELDTTDSWIVERTGISERRVGGTTTELAVAAGRGALARAGVDPAAVDVVLVATTTPDQPGVAVSPVVQDELGTAGAAFDLNAACSGFVYGLVTAHGLLLGGAQTVLLIGSETLSRITDWKDRRTAPLFGDGAGAVVLRRVEGTGGVLGWDLGADGSLEHLLNCPHGGTLTMNGREVFRHAVRMVLQSSQAALGRAGLGAADVDLFVPHQANIRIIAAAAARLGIGEDRWALTIGRYGNTSAASIPLTIADAADGGRLAPGATVLLSGFGGGMTWASVVLRWGGAPSSA